MMKMLIQLDEECVKKDGKYSLGDIWKSIDGKFSPECIKEEQPDGSVLYSGNPNRDYYTRINVATMFLKRQKWFAEYCVKWIWYDNDDDEEMPYQEIDVLARQRKENSLFTIGGKWNAEKRKPSISI